MSTAPAPRRTYRIVKVEDMLPGDIIKISRRKVASVEPHPQGTALYFTPRPLRGGGFIGSGATPHVHHNGTKFGVYR